ncbi:hypothetical protein [Paenibacillus harenae]|uniref:Uncharacterized protein n=1 Tax=Paenibacillus harenae TaxID=306543 RepID=A0ABT9TZI6_PAEHA|nr:hypothetical protein [Paenibacillus harenae]MDQ0111865.1 hypothetical protein [Paenibacillus harenae]
MATRVSLFLEQRHYAFEAWGSDDPVMLRHADNYRIIVSQGRNPNYANIEVQRTDAQLTLRFGLCDLNQEQPLMLESMRQSVATDTEDDAFDCWDTIPPFGVVELYGFQIEHSARITGEELAAFFALIRRFLLKHFLMIAFLDREIDAVRAYMNDWHAEMKPFVHDGAIGYRVKEYG